MIGLDRLMDRKGVIAAGQFTDDGKVVRSVGDIAPGQMEQIAKICAGAQTDMSSRAKALAEHTGTGWQPLEGWALTGGNRALLVVGNTGVLVDVVKVDFGQIWVDLYGPPAAGTPVP
jgi:roadblock/LC7 domain-containing protein